jgi:hypothetical protein
MKNQSDGIVTMAVLLIGGCSMFYKAIRTHRRLRHIQDTPRSKVSSAAQGLVEMQGFAWPQSTCAKTIDQKHAVYYEFILQVERKKSGKNKGSEWVTVFSKTHNPSFFLVDPTGIAIIHPAQAEIEMMSTGTRNWRSLSAEQKAFVNTEIVTDLVTGFPPNDFLFGVFGSNFRILEKSILRGSPLYASGDFRTRTQEAQPIQSKGLSRFTDMIFNHEARSEKNVQSLLDKNKDGKVSHQEAVQGYVFAADTAIQRTTMDSLPERDFQYYGEMQKSDLHPLVLAPALERHLVDDLRYKPAFLLAGGSGLIATSIVMLAMQMGMTLPTFSSRQPAAVTVEIQKEKPSDALNITKLHQKCISMDRSSCETLLDAKVELELQPEHVQYYANQACRLGSQRHCLKK